ncbi:MAG: DUF86 domain-containing protein [Rhodocyclaceae bacterium]|jgi:uncharacterized protein with HEPN domain|nr:DUF86 domain-containing protein [Rhodocyclaceae bacterium]MDP3037276.1 DUF86 domain-containing protein [Rhodocyclaceae bacterium]
MSERHCDLYLTDIIESGRAIQSYVQGVEFAGFVNDRMRYAAVIREFEIVGEAVGKLPESIRARYPDVPWREIKDFRNILIHEYFGVDLRIVWNAAQQDLPLLLAAATEILAEAAESSQTAPNG